ncbi:MAG: hypothetical protein JST14_07930 [Bacteroidetes bacterium]|nr:hypothetical protein [Bacteroidota bacterium]
MKGNHVWIIVLMAGMIFSCVRHSAEPEPVVSGCSTSLLGDKDGFGMNIKDGGSFHLAGGTSLPLDHRSSSDPVFTDIYSPTLLMPGQTNPVSFSYTQQFEKGPLISKAVLHLNTLGIQDGDHQVYGCDYDIRLYLDGHEIPHAFDNVDQFDLVNGTWSEFASKVDVDIPTDLLPYLNDGVATFRWEVYQTQQGCASMDAFMIDYSELELCRGTDTEHH